MESMGQSKIFFNQQHIDLATKFTRRIIEESIYQLRGKKNVPISSKLYQQLEGAFAIYLKNHQVLKKIPLRASSRREFNETLVEELCGTIDFYGLDTAYLFVDDVINFTLKKICAS